MGLLWLIAGCDCGGDSGLIGGELVVSPNPAAFADAPVGGLSRLDLVFANPGEGPVEIFSARALAPLDAEFRLEGVPVRVAAKGQHVVSATFTPASAGPRQGRLIVETDSAITPRVEVPVLVFARGTSLRVSPARLDFGAVALGRTATASARVENVGRADVEIQAVTVDFGNSPEFASALDGRRRLRPGDGFDLTVRYTPIDLGIDVGDVLLVDDSGEPVATRIGVQGEGARIGVVVEPDALSFPGVRVGETQTRAFDLRNLGPSAAVVTRLSVVEGEAFSIATSTETATPLALEPGAFRRLRVSYAPRTIGRHAGRIEVSTESGAVAALGLSGQAWPVLAPQVEALPATIDFGTVEVGASMVRVVAVVNTGGADLQLASPPSIDLADPAFSVVADAVAPLVLVPGDEHLVAVAFAPALAGAVSGRLVVASDDPLEPRLEVSLRGLGVGASAPALVVEPAIDLGRVPAGELVQRFVHLRNEGTARLTISDIVFTEASEGRIGWASPSFPLRVSPGAMAAFPLTFFDLAGAPGRWTAQLVVTSDDPDGATAIVAAVGETIPPRATPPELDIEASWFRPASVDLHLVQAGGQLYDRPSDVCFCNPNPDWGARFDAEDDPLLDSDEVLDLGPSRIRLGRASGSEHAVVVVRGEDGDAEPLGVRVTVQSGGLFIAEETRALGPGQRWDVGVATPGVGWTATALPLVDEPRHRCF